MLSDEKNRHLSIDFTGALRFPFFCNNHTFSAYTAIMNKLKSYAVIGSIFVIIIGSISHFIYDWFGNNFILGFIFPINESTWEHMKLCFFPMLLYSWYMGQKLRYAYPCITSSLLAGTLLGTFLIPIIFYTYSGILGHNIIFLDITTFIVSILLAFFAIYKLALSCRTDAYIHSLQFLVLIIAVCFFIFTYYPLNIGIFHVPGN